MEDFERRATANQARAHEVLRQSQVESLWREAGAEVHRVGSLRTGLLMDHRDIDLHIYTDTLDTGMSFAVMARLAADPRIERIECRNLSHTEEACIEWHAWYRDDDEAIWQIDMIHIRRGSAFDGYFERVAERIGARLTPESRRTILRLKAETPPETKIPGIFYCRAVLADGVATYGELVRWLADHPTDRIETWMP